LKYGIPNSDIEFSESIQFKYMAHENKFYIIEEIETEDGNNYFRVWILE